MGLSSASTGINLLQEELKIEKATPEDRIIALGGNPNVGKSTVFNGLTGLNQHTGNWPGKTVTNAYGVYRYKESNFILVDIPGTYSLMANSVEEEVARDFICFGEPHTTVIVVDATCLERNLNLVLQTLEITSNVILCVNLMDEANRDMIVTTLINLSERISKEVVTINNKAYNDFDRKIDDYLTSKKFGIPIMILLLMVIFWITISGANIPSELLAKGFSYMEGKLTLFFQWIKAPPWLHNVLVLGIYRTLSWVVSVMLPPMAIFFPLFTLLEDLGYLPRVAFNLDNFFKKSHACGKQALTMCMGFGCNAAGVIGCRIIDSSRERLIAIITNNFVPCNGRFPILIAVISMFFVGFFKGPFQSIFLALILTAVIILGILMTLLVSKFLSRTILKGLPSSFTLELPPYRKPQVGKIIIRSILDRTLFVLGRAVVVAIPAGLIIWIMANLYIGESSLLTYTANFLNPLAKLIGLDGHILLAFILGFPANEIVIPILLMSYMATGSLVELDNLVELKAILIANGWTWVTALSVMLFSLMHWPCATTCLTIRKETQSLKWTIISFLVPTVAGFTACFIVVNLIRIIGLI